MKIGMKLIWLYVVLAIVALAVLAVVAWVVRTFKRICRYGKVCNRRESTGDVLEEGVSEER